MRGPGFWYAFHRGTSAKVPVWHLVGKPNKRDGDHIYSVCRTQLDRGSAERRLHLLPPKSACKRCTK